MTYAATYVIFVSVIYACLDINLSKLRDLGIPVCLSLITKANYLLSKVATEQCKLASTVNLPCEIIMPTGIGNTAPQIAASKGIPTPYLEIDFYVPND